MHPTRNDLPEASRRGVADLLNARHTDAIDLMRQAKQAHGNLKGLQLFALHGLFDKVHAAASAAGDELAERAVQLGGTAERRLAPVARRTTLRPSRRGARPGRRTSQRSRARWPRRRGRCAPRSARQTSWARPPPPISSPKIVRELDAQLWRVEAHAQGAS